MREFMRKFMREFMKELIHAAIVDIIQAWLVVITRVGLVLITQAGRVDRILPGMIRSHEDEDPRETDEKNKQTNEETKSVDDPRSKLPFLFLFLCVHVLPDPHGDQFELIKDFLKVRICSRGMLLKPGDIMRLFILGGFTRGWGDVKDNVWSVTSELDH